MVRRTARTLPDTPPWVYDGKPILSIEDCPRDAVGFIYLIEDTVSNRYYIGRKLIYATRSSIEKNKTNDGVRRRRRNVETDWRSYWSSCHAIVDTVRELGLEEVEKRFRRVILAFATSRGSLTYMEECALYTVGALEREDFLNDNIRAKVYRKWVRTDDARMLRRSLQNYNTIVD